MKLQPSSRLRLIHWNTAEAAPLIELLRGSGYQVEFDLPFQFTAIKNSTPDAFIIDLTRMPSHGREIGCALRSAKKTRQTPLLFLEGAPEKVAAIRRVLPDAVYASRAELLTLLPAALKSAPATTEPVVPLPMMHSYERRNAAQKLGVDSQSLVSVIDPPRDYRKVLGPLPAGVTISESSDAADVEPADVTLCFVHEPDALAHALTLLRRVVAKSRLWILWRKQTSRKSTALTQNLIRATAAELGLVDYKICAVNSVWSAILFTRKRARSV